MNLGAAEVLILLVVIVALMILPAWAVIDAAVRPDWAWNATSQSKVLWVVIPIATSVIGFGWLVALVYLIGIRPRVAEAQRGGSGYTTPPAF